MTDEKRETLARFLRTRRERITPETAGLPVGGGRRRTRGLRREEVAILAGVSPTWYTYLEQGRDIRPSVEVLDSLARVLNLDADERRYMHRLAGSSTPLSAEPLGDVHPAAGSLLAEVVAVTGGPGLPVYGGNKYGDVLAWNEAAARWYTDFGALAPDRRNMLWWMLTDPLARERIADWEADTRDLVARLRAAHATRPWDPGFTARIALFARVSAEFRRWWDDHDVREQHIRVRRMNHPELGTLTVRLVVLHVAADAFNSVVLHLPVDTD